MNVLFDVPMTDTKDRCFLTWVPVPVRVRLQNAGGGAATHSVTLRNAGAQGGGKVVFDMVRREDGEASLTVDLPSDGTPVEVWVAGEFGEASTDYGDAQIEAVDVNGASLGKRNLMVRVRKDAVKLTDDERARFLDALAELNDAGLGPFQSFRDMHRGDSYPEAHSFAGFLPWHRAYLLDLERSLQAIDARVTLPYWRFDQPAPELFAADFFGMPDPATSKGDTVILPHGHPLEFWKTDGSAGIVRRPTYDISSAPPQYNAAGGERVISQDATLKKGEPGDEFFSFRTMERAPHGAAHTSFGASNPIWDPAQAPKDPLFFLLHCNVDRLWAFWQWKKRRTKDSESSSYSLVGSQRADDQGNVGAALDDTMWPWNGEMSAPRPNYAPRPSFPPSPFLTSPGQQPTVRSMIDFQGVHTGLHLGFCYDDVPFELEQEVVVG